MSDIIINDGFVTQSGKIFEEAAEELEDTLKTYLRLLREINARGIMAGDTAEALELFISVAEKLTGKFSDFGQGAESACNTFITKMENADKDLYTGI